MSRRSRTTLVLSVRAAVPPGWTQKQLIHAIEVRIKSMEPPFAPQEVVVKVESRETIYL